MTSGSTTSSLKSDNITVVIADHSFWECRFLPSMLQIRGRYSTRTARYLQRSLVSILPAVIVLLPPGNGICSASIQTSTIDFVIATTAINDAGGRGVYNDRPPPGFTQIANGNSHFEVDYVLTTVSQTTVFS